MKYFLKGSKKCNHFKVQKSSRTKLESGKVKKQKNLKIYSNISELEYNYHCFISFSLLPLEFIVTK